MEDKYQSPWQLHVMGELAHRLGIQSALSAIVRAPFLVLRISNVAQGLLSFTRHPVRVHRRRRPPRPFATRPPSLLNNTPPAGIIFPVSSFRLAVRPRHVDLAFPCPVSPITICQRCSSCILCCRTTRSCACLPLTHTRSSCSPPDPYIRRVRH